MAPAIRSISPTLARRNGLTLFPMGLRLCFSLLASLHAAAALPLDSTSIGLLQDEDLPKDPKNPSLWVYLGTAVALVLLGGAFAGLTIALMGQDEIYLQVIATSGEGAERKNAKKVLDLLKKGKHWVLVTLLLSNVITNETLPIVLDRSLGGGWPAVLSSTILIVIFGEIVPQSICVRYGLPIGAWMAPLVLGLMWIMSPIAWPTAKLLDYLLGEDHGTTYKKAGLKTLVTLHKTLGTHPDDRLNQDEVTIITAVLDLKDKPVGSIMTPMKDVFTMSTETVLDEEMMGIILSAGYSRIPIHTPDNPNNFVGMLLVKMLITYDPEDAFRVKEFSLATLPETRPDTSCLDIVNFFQEGKSHMVLVSDYPGEAYGALGVVTLEDVIEELIGEEIIDESDVFIDVHKAIRRMAPAPRTRVPTRVPKGEVVADKKDAPQTKNHSEVESEQPSRRADSEPSNPAPQLGTSPKLPTTFLMRRRSSGTGSAERTNGHFMLRSDDPDIRQHLKHLGPSNAAQNPKQTRINTVKIKPGGIPSTIPENMTISKNGQVIGIISDAQGGVGEGLLESAGREASDAVHSVAVGYGTMDPTTNPGFFVKADADGGEQHDLDGQISPKSLQPSNYNSPTKPSHSRSRSTSTIGSLPSTPKAKKRQTARSGSITENFVDINGVRKIILETTSSSDSEDRVFIEAKKSEERHEETETDGKTEQEGDKKGKKKRKKRAGKKKKKGEGSKSGAEGENEPLLGKGN